MTRSVVITGIGALSAFGAGIDALWSGLLSGKSALGPPSRFDPSALSARLWGEIPEYAARDYLPKSYRKATKLMARDAEIAVGVAKLAVDDARLTTRAHEGAPQTYPSSRVGCQIGAGLISPEVQELGSAMVTAVTHHAAAEHPSRSGWDTRAWGTRDAGDGLATGGMGNLPPLWMLKYLPNMLACHVSIIHGAEGPSNTHTCSEASGLLSVGEATRVIERDGADCCFAGSAESKLNVNAAVRLAIARRLARAMPDEDPLKVVRPFSPESRGSLFGEGGGILILEEESKALARSATPYARVLGFGAAQSVENVIPPFDAPVGGTVNEGLADAIDHALADAQVSPSSVRAVVSQACGTSAFDTSELAALQRVFANRSVPVVGLVPFIGDCAAGNGGLQIAVGAMILRNAELPSPLTGSAGEQSAGCVLVCSSAQGGQNAAIVLGVA